MKVSTTKIEKQIGYGSECTVYDVGNGRCYKRYGEPEIVDTVYENALKAYKAGIAPEVYGKDENGYYTEIVEVFNCRDCLNRPCSFIAICEIYKNEISQIEYGELCAKVCEVFGKYADGDLSMMNLGIKNGKLIVIDFGILSGLNVEE